MSCFCYTRITAYAVCRKGLPKMRGTLLSSSVSRITKSTGNVNVQTSTSIFSAIPIGIERIWHKINSSAKISQGVAREGFAEGIWNKETLGVSEFVGTLFWMIAELSSLREKLKKFVQAYACY
ncbi:hypothetical protein Tco_1199841 [Tanacetum coccineum]